MDKTFQYKLTFSLFTANKHFLTTRLLHIWNPSYKGAWDYNFQASQSNILRLYTPKKGRIVIVQLKKLTPEKAE